jgi:hypothetical protein
MKKNVKVPVKKAPVRSVVLAKGKKINKAVNPLDKAIMEGKKLPSKNKKYPGDTDVKMPGFKKKPIIKIKKK